VDPVLEELALCTQGGVIPFVCLGDWNAPPAEVGRRPEVAALSAGLLLPPVEFPTCHAAARAVPSTIDFGLISDVLRPLAPESLTVDYAVPFGTHAAISLRLARNPDLLLGRVPVAARAVPPPVPRPPGAPEDADAQWDRAFRAARALAGEVGPRADVALADEQARSLGFDHSVLWAQWMVWGQARVLYGLHAAGVDWVTGAEPHVAPYLGRGRLPSFQRRVPVHLRSDDCPDIPAPAAAPRHVRSLEVLKVCLIRASTVRIGRAFWGIRLLDLLSGGHPVAENLRRGLEPMDYAKVVQGATSAALAGADWEPCDTAPPDRGEGAHREV